MVNEKQAMFLDLYQRLKAIAKEKAKSLEQDLDQMERILEEIWKLEEPKE